MDDSAHCLCVRHGGDWAEPPREITSASPKIGQKGPMKFRKKPVVIEAMQADHMDLVVTAIIRGLVTDGAHHKQHALESVLQLLVEPEWIERAQRELQWESGIPS